MHEWTGDARWADAWQESADELMRRREDDGLWTTHLYGGTGRSLGPAHGLVGNVLALRRRLPASRESSWNGSRQPRWLPGPLSRTGSPTGPITRRWLTSSGVPEVPGSSSRRRITSTRSCFWPGRSSSGRRGRTATRRATASATERPGTATRCSRAFERTGDERWLGRARRFAVHALEQADGSRPAAGAGATRSGRETSAPPSTLPIALTSTLGTRSSRRGNDGGDRVPADGRRRPTQAPRLAAAAARPSLVE